MQNVPFKMNFRRAGEVFDAMFGKNMLQRRKIVGACSYLRDIPYLQFCLSTNILADLGAVFIPLLSSHSR